MDGTGNLGFIVPIALQDHERRALPAGLIKRLREQGGTCVYLPLTEQASEQLLPASDFAELDPLVLLFLNKLQQLEVSMLPHCLSMMLHCLFMLLRCLFMLLS